MINDNLPCHKVFRHELVSFFRVHHFCFFSLHSSLFPTILSVFLPHPLALNNNKMALDERLTCTSSSISSSDDDGLASFSTRPTTPEWSPQFSSYREEPSIESQFSGLSAGHSNDLSHVRAYQALPDPTDARTAAGQAVKNICYIGAGYVGE